MRRYSPWVEGGIATLAGLLTCPLFLLVLALVEGMSPTSGMDFGAGALGNALLALIVAPLGGLITTVVVVFKRTRQASWLFISALLWLVGASVSLLVGAVLAQ